MVRRAIKSHTAGWRSLVSRLAHNQEATGSNPVPATKPIEWQHNLSEKAKVSRKIVENIIVWSHFNRPSTTLAIPSPCEGCFFYMLADE